MPLRARVVARFDGRAPALEMERRRLFARGQKLVGAPDGLRVAPGQPQRLAEGRLARLVSRPGAERRFEVIGGRPVVSGAQGLPAARVALGGVGAPGAAAAQDEEKREQGAPGPVLHFFFNRALTSASLTSSASSSCSYWASGIEALAYLSASICFSRS